MGVMADAMAAAAGSTTIGNAAATIGGAVMTIVASEKDSVLYMVKVAIS